MGILKPKSEKKTKQVILVNAKGNEKYADLVKNKSLLDIDAEMNLLDIHLGTSSVIGNDGNPIRNLVLELEDKMLAIPFSRTFDYSLLEGDSLPDCKCYKNFKKDDQGNITEEEYISFGKPDGITLELTSLVNKPVDATA